MESLKDKFFHRLFDPKGANGTKLEEACKFLEKEEINARSCYMGDIKLSSDEFLKMLLVDGSFMIQLLRDLSENEFKQVPSLSRWMLPTISRELIMLENQLPIHSIRPKLIGEELRGCQSEMIHSITELKEGVKIKACEDRELLDISFWKKWGIMIKELTMPPVYIGDHRGTVFRNMVAFEKCYKRCNPDMTTYMFFLNGLINSADDVSVLHYKGIIHHSLGSDEHVAELINNIAKEIVPDMNESYLYKVVNEANEYLSCWRSRFRASIVHQVEVQHNIAPAITIIPLRPYRAAKRLKESELDATQSSNIFGALLFLYFTFIQAICGFADVYTKLENPDRPRNT
ncbi:hypothetical protein TSUD_300140 [Trifolium subterraneum]|uniref:Uncharacterized protein n=1 Tax=Trifolium subterraneum TaxID=3900 RepID=A0A2Z6NHX1_TRISU|nr:hypothetical protein TSUD_300140 [Trifolium subterraneum]